VAGWIEATPSNGRKEPFMENPPLVMCGPQPSVFEVGRKISLTRDVKACQAPAPCRRNRAQTLAASVQGSRRIIARGLTRDTAAGSPAVSSGARNPPALGDPPTSPLVRGVGNGTAPLADAGSPCPVARSGQWAQAGTTAGGPGPTVWAARGRPTDAGI
jgi:hypothetical protein